MKNSARIYCSLALLACLLFSIRFTAAASPAGPVLLNQEVKKLIISGNIRVLLEQSMEEYVTVEDDQLDKVTITQEGNTMRICSNQAVPVTATVYLSNPFRIDASGSSRVTTQGKFNLKYLQIMLHDQATACIKAKTVSLYTVINDHAQLELLGSTEEHIIRTEGIARLKTDHFAALKTARELPSTVLAATRKKTILPADSVVRRQLK